MRARRSSSDTTTVYSTVLAVIAGIILTGMALLILATFCKLRGGSITPVPSPEITIMVEDSDLLTAPPPTLQPGSPARKLKYRSQTLKELKAEIASLTRPIIAELKSYSSPPKPVHRTMIAVYTLLGEPEKGLREWDNILHLLKRSGKGSLMARIADFKSEDASAGLVVKVRKQVADMTSAEVASAGKSVSSLFLWVNTVCS